MKNAVYIYYMKDRYKEKYKKKVYTVSRTLYFLTLLPELLFIYLLYLVLKDRLFLVAHAGSAILFVWITIFELMLFRANIQLNGNEMVTGIVSAYNSKDIGLYPGQHVKLIRAIVDGYVVEDEQGQEYIVGQYDIVEEI
ncbi:hypothetical protein ENBRE01_3230 [Enteropsectra breve]|nr:hypothetical protein ENBRE01_3230 [Enteropsectra breve]